MKYEFLKVLSFTYMSRRLVRWEKNPPDLFGIQLNAFKLRDGSYRDEIIIQCVVKPLALAMGI